MSENELLAHKNCYLGISLENPVFKGETLRALMLWAVSNFENCLMVIGDDLCRFNQKITNGYDDEQALQAAHAKGDDFLSQNELLFEELKDRNIRITRWNEHIHSNLYHETRGTLHNIFATNNDFKALIEKDAHSFVRRMLRRNEKFSVDRDQAVSLCCDYLLEEIAVFSSLSEQGWPVEVYPGSELHALVEVSKGKFPCSPQGRKDRSNVGLKIE